MNLSTLRTALTPARRKRIYRTLVAVGGVLLVYGLATPEQVEAWLQVVSAALLVGSAGLAERNTPKDK